MRLCRTQLTMVLLWAALVTSISAAAETPPSPYAFTPPATLKAPKVSRTLMGTTYAYLPTRVDEPIRLTITTLSRKAIKTQLGELSDTRCANLFLDELRRQHQGFFVIEMKRPLTVGAREFPQFRWTGRRSGQLLTGVLSCGQLEHHYFVIDFIDDVRAASSSFPAIRAALRGLRLTLSESSTR